MKAVQGELHMARIICTFSCFFYDSVVQDKKRSSHNVKGLFHNINKVTDKFGRSSMYAQLP